MNKRIMINVARPTALMQGDTHTGTTYLVSKNIDFSNPVLEDINNTTDLYSTKFDVELDEDEPFYIKTKYVLNNGDKETNFSLISTLYGDQEGVTISDAIVNTPLIELNINKNNLFNGEIVITTSDFKMFTSVGEHDSTTYLVKSFDGKILHERKHDKENLTSYIIPKDVDLTKGYYVEVYHHADILVTSNPGIAHNVDNIASIGLFSVKQIGKLVTTRDLFFKLDIRTTKYRKIQVKVFDYNGNFIYENLNIDTTTPSLSKNLFTEGIRYKFIFKLDLYNEYSDEVILEDIAIGDHIIYNEFKDYLDKFDYKQMFFTNGKTSQLSYQLFNDTVMLTNNNSKDIKMIKVVDGKIFDLGVIQNLPVENDILSSEFFCQGLTNGNVVIAYSSRDEDSYGNVFICNYEFNPATNGLTLLHKHNTGVNDRLIQTGSITTNWRDEIYYVKFEGDNRLPVLVKYKPLENSLETIHIPISSQVKSSLSLCRNMDDDIVIIGGCSVSETKMDTEIGERVNDKVYIYKVNENRIVETGLNLLEKIDKAYYSFHMVLRHDGLITIFNNLDNNNYEKIKDQSTHILDIKNNSLDVKYNDYNDDLVYLNTIVLNNGDVIRISSIGTDPQKVYTYISNTMTDGEIDDMSNVVRDPKHLVVSENTEYTNDNIYQYDTVKIEAGAKINLVTPRGVEVLDEHTLVITRDTVMTAAEFKASKYERVYAISSNIIIEETD